MTRSLFLLILLILLRITSINGQLVNEKYTRNLFTDAFESDAGVWKIMSNADNLFLIQEGKYLLQRKNAKTAYSVFPKWENPANAYEINSTFTLESTEGPESAAGLIFMAQPDGSGAFVFEINCLQQYRLKQLVGVNYRLLTGSTKTNGWVMSPFLKGQNQPNQIQVRTSNRNYDIYINQNYILSFTELAYKTGSTGISIGPLSKFTLDHISVYGIADSGSVNPDLDVVSSGLALPSDSQSIMLEELKKLRIENQILKDSLELFKAERKTKKSKPVKADNIIPEPVRHPE